MATKLDPKNHRAFFNWGAALANLKRHEEAHRMWAKAKELAPPKS